MTPVLTAEGVTFRHGARTALAEASLALVPGEVVGVIGPNGAGKTTLVRLLAGLDSPHAGAVRVDGRPLAAWRRRDLARVVALVPQDPTVLFPFTVLEVVLMGRVPHLGALAFPAAADVARAEAALARLEIADLAARPIDALSGGERQRAFVARALAQEPRVLLLDEPTTHLDLRHQAVVLAVVRDAARRDGVAALVVLHDLNLAATYCDRLVLLAGGRAVAAGAPRAVLTPERIAGAFRARVWVGEHPGHAAPVVLPLDDAD